MLSNTFTVLIKVVVWFFFYLYFVNEMIYIDWFSNIKPPCFPGINPFYCFDLTVLCLEFLFLCLKERLALCERVIFFSLPGLMLIMGLTWNASSFFKLFIWNNFRFMGSCKDSTESSYSPFIHFPLIVISYL